VRSRIVSLPPSDLVDLGERLLNRLPSLNLQEALVLARGADEDSASELTCRKLLQVLSELPDISGPLV
jgi:hypothetical protein